MIYIMTVRDKLVVVGCYVRGADVFLAGAFTRRGARRKVSKLIDEFDKEKANG